MKLTNKKFSSSQCQDEEELFFRTINHSPSVLSVINANKKKLHSNTQEKKTIHILSQTYASCTPLNTFSHLWNPHFFQTDP